MTKINSNTIETWFAEIERGLLVLPRFQRHPAWRDDQVASLFENVLRKPSLPIGVLLILSVGDDQPFQYRPIDGAPDASPNPRMHLLDGQQRMTAIWKALTNGHEQARFFVDLSPHKEEIVDQDVSPPPETVAVRRQPIRTTNGHVTPLWVEDPSGTADRNLLPLTILRPGADGEAAAEQWLQEATNDPATIMKLQKVITNLRSRIANYQVPYLELDKSTGQDTALDVFINMNTSATPLKAYDIVVAQHEGATGESLHSRLDELRSEIPAMSRFDKIEDTMLSVAALIMKRAPIKKTYLSSDFASGLEEHWLHIETAFRRGLAFLQEEGVFGTAFVPNDSAMQLSLALWGEVPEGSGAKEGNARDIIRSTFWRGCLSDRYGKTSATRSFADYAPLYDTIHNGGSLEACQLFNEKDYPISERDELMRAGWPKKKDRLPRSILALSLRAGGRDFDDGSLAAPGNLSKREYHHLFPTAVLNDMGGTNKADRALNCALITWQTNRRIAAKTPADYIKAQAEAAHLGLESVRQRLESHLVPYEELVAGDYEAFLEARAERLMAEIATSTSLRS